MTRLTLRANGNFAGSPCGDSARRAYVSAALRGCGHAYAGARARMGVEASPHCIHAHPHARAHVNNPAVPATPQRRRRGAGLRFHDPAGLPATPQTHRVHAPATLCYEF